MCEVMRTYISHLILAKLQKSVSSTIVDFLKSEIRGN